MGLMGPMGPIAFLVASDPFAVPLIFPALANWTASAARCTLAASIAIDASQPKPAIEVKA